MRGYLSVLWHLGLLDEVFPVSSPGSDEHRVRLRKMAEDDF